MPYRKPSKSQMRKVLALKGGFAPAAKQAYKYAKPFMNKKLTPQQQKIMEEVVKVTASGGISMEQFKKSTTKLMSSLKEDAFTTGTGVKVALKLYEAVNTSSGAKVGSEDVLQQSSSVTTAQPGLYSSNPGKRYKVSLELGNPSSRSVKNYMKQNGSKKTILVDTMRQAGDQDPTTNLRDLRELATGFNQKLLYTNVNNQLDLQDVIDLYSLSGTVPGNFDKDSTITAYGIASDVKDSFKFFNLNTYNACDLKVHVVSANGSHGFRRSTPFTPKYPLSCITGEFTALDYDIARFLPAWKVLRDVTTYKPPGVGVDGNNNRGYFYAHVDPTAQATQSPTFNENFTIHHTVKKRLQPGDQLDLSITTNLGSGFNLSEIYSRFKESVAATNNGTGLIDGKAVNPLNFFYIIELVGQKTIAVVTTGEKPTGAVIPKTSEYKEKYIGTAPSKIFYEFKQEINLGTQILDSLTDITSSSDGFSQPSLPVKVYTRDEKVDQTKIFNKGYGSTDIYVPSVSDAIVVDSKPLSSPVT